MCTIRHAKQRHRFSTGLKVKQSEWDSEIQNLKKSSKSYLVVNGKKSDIEIEIDKLIKRCELLDQVPSKADFKNIILGEEETSKPTEKTILDYYSKYIGIKEKDTVNYSRNTIKLYKKAEKKLTRFIGNRKTTLEDVNPEFIASFITFLTEEGISDKSINLMHLKLFKAFMNFALSQDWTNNFKGTKIKISNEREPNIALTSAELLQIVNFEPLTPAQRKVKTQFLLQCFQGLRISEILSLTLESFDLENNTISIYEKKKSRVQKRPLLPTTKELFQNVISKEGLSFYSEMTYGKVLKEICRLAGLNRVEQVGRKYGGVFVSRLVPIHEKITSHHGRATFITLSTEMGLLDEDIMLITGISNPKTLLYYKRLKDENKIKRLNSKWSMEYLTKMQQAEAV